MGSLSGSSEVSFLLNSLSGSGSGSGPNMVLGTHPERNVHLKADLSSSSPV